MRLFLKVVVLFSISLLLLISIVAFFFLQAAPHLSPRYHVNAQLAKSSEQLLKRIKYSLTHTSKFNALDIKNRELQALSAITNRSYPFLIVDATIEAIDPTLRGYQKANKLVLKSSLDLSIPFYKPYLNIQIDVLPSDSGISLGDVSIGALRFSGYWLLPLAEFVTNKLQAELGTVLLSTIKSLTIQSEQLTINYQLPTDFSLFSAQKKSRLLILRDQLALFGDVEKVRFYFQRLSRFIENEDNKTTFLIDYIRFMMTQATEQTYADTTLLATNENQSALLALVIYFGSPKFELLVGEVSSLSLNKNKTREQLMASVKVLNRNDLQKHFVYSMAIQLLSGHELSNTLGELKEFLDANEGGTGFSFADLMADRAGNQFAILATQSEHSALKLQAYFSHQQNYSEKLTVLPSIINLPEGLSQANFEQHYQDVNSETYVKMITLIDQRLATIEIYHQ